MTEEEHADFMERLTAYSMSQSEFIRQVITGAPVKPIINISCVNDYTRAGAEQQCTAAAMRHFRAGVMEMCQERKQESQ